MPDTQILCSEEQMLIIQKITNASRQEVIYTIRISRISVEEIIRSLKKSALKMLPFGGAPFLSKTGNEFTPVRKKSLYLPQH